MIQTSGASASDRIVTAEDIRDTLGAVGDDVITAILDIGATVEEFEEAVACAAGESDVMGDLRRPLSAAAAAVCTILASSVEADDDDHPPPAA